MATERLTYAQIGERLSVSAEAARAIVKRHRLPRSRSNDDKALAAIDLTSPCPRGHRAVTAQSPVGQRRGRHTQSEDCRTGSRARRRTTAFGRSAGGL